MQEQLKSSLMDEHWLIIVTPEATIEDFFVGLYTALSMFSLFDDGTFYFMK